jgi:hypothetical protein
LASKIMVLRRVISAPITTAPSWWSRFWKDTSRGRFVKIFKKKGKKKIGQEKHARSAWRCVQINLEIFWKMRID